MPALQLGFRLRRLPNSVADSDDAFPDRSPRQRCLALGTLKKADLPL